MSAAAATSVVDLRGLIRTDPTALAQRPDRLDGLSVALFDNGKLSPPHESFTAVYEVLSAVLQSRAPGVRVSRMTADLLVDDGTEANVAVAAIVGAGIDAAVIGLLDQGVTQASVRFAVELERLGVPTTLLCQGSGGRLAAAMAGMLAPGLPATTLEVAKSADYAQVEAETHRLAGRVLNGFAPAPPPDAATTRSAGWLDLSAEDPSAVYSEAMASAGIGDGLPMVAPTESRIERMLAAAGLGAGDEVWPVIAPRSEAVYAHDAAAVAVAAGCPPEAFAIVAAAYRAMAGPGFALYQAAISTHPGGTLVLASGPAAQRAGLSGGAGCLGPGRRVNASVGRAVALAGSVFLGARPGEASLCVQGSPAQFAYCCAENVEQSPWPSLAAELAGEGSTTITVLKGEGPQSVIDDVSTTSESLLGTVASAMTSLASNNAYRPAHAQVVLLNPGHAALLALEGWTRSDVAARLFELARNDPAQLAGRGGHPGWPPEFAELDRYPVVFEPGEILLAVAGEPGLHSAVVRPWPVSRASTVVLS
jgi:hypothetical protein